MTEKNLEEREAEGPEAGEPLVLPEQARKAVASCKEGRFQEALPDLERILGKYRETGKVPARLLSYYGVCLAEVRGKIADGLECCRISIQKDRFFADHYSNIARIYVLGRSRRKAVQALKAAENFDEDNLLAIRLWEEIGRRKSPVLSFLPRDHALNVLLGRMQRKKGG